MNLNFYITIAISAGAGTALVELAIKLWLGHWFKKKYYNFTLAKADRRNCADRVVDLISSRHYMKWADFNNEIYHTANKLSDKLLILGENKYSKRLDDYTNAQRYAQQILSRVRGPNSQKKDDIEFINSQHRVDKLRIQLVDIAKKLKEN